MAGMGTCKACGRMIVWIRTAGGKIMPCDAERVRYWLAPGGRGRIVTDDGVVVSAALDGPDGEADGYGYVSHFATCTAADRFRRR